ncbi:MAG: phosphoribosylamine--glycine ligase [Thermoanaerobacteraceae bacterium]|nr:phosphoribosylamine--glycine ligase [Thermoanaerobacteraceae bacterium]
MNVLVIGSGGREHAIVWKLRQDERIDRIYVVPGNGGTVKIAENIDIDLDSHDLLAEFAKDNVDLTIVGPEAPLVDGIVDFFEDHGLKIFGPCKKAAMLEGSKVYAKDFMKRHGIPTAGYEVFDNAADAMCYLKNASYPVVIKADGLAAGKGVMIAEDFGQAEEAIGQIMIERHFGESGSRVVIEEYLQGHEVSLLAFTDGNTVVPMIPTMDYKKAYDGDAGPNTGGMGNITPNPYMDEDNCRYAVERILKPTIEGLNRDGIKYKGVLYAGLMLTEKGPKVLEYNVRFGDPETQVILPLLKTPLLNIISAIIDERLDEINVEWKNGHCITIVIASGGYPGNYKTGYEITGLDEVSIPVFHAGTRYMDGKYLTSGGRVLNVTATGETLDEARETVYSEIKKINFKDMYFRKDIGILT